MATQTIAIEECVPTGAIDPLFIEKSFYLAPEQGAERAFRLLWAALVETGLVAVAKYSAHRRQVVVSLRPHGELLALHQLRYAREVVPVEDVPTPDFPELKAPELQLGKQILEHVTCRTFDPRRYRDEVQERIAELLAHKVAGDDVQAPGRVEQSKVLDFIAALRASLDDKR